ncbi:MAG: hypothetical protein AB7S77_02060 [Desulfatirhabdiaceae bacterium]
MGVGEEDESGIGCEGESDAFYGLHDIRIFDMVILPVPYGRPIFEIRRRNGNSRIVQNQVSKPMAYWEPFFNRYFQLIGIYDFCIEIKGKG